VKRIPLFQHYLESYDFVARGVSMNLHRANFQTDEPNSVAGGQRQVSALPGPRIERCEFETLLERALQILSARAKEAAASHS
jgi:hypothetical protein